MVVTEIIDDKGSVGYATLYESFEFHRRNVVKHTKCTPDDVGKYLKLNDGSKMYALISKIYKDNIYTSNGLYYRWQVIIDSYPRLCSNSYSGAKSGSESFQITPPTIEEREESLANYVVGKLKGSERVKRMSNDLVIQVLAERGLDANHLINKTIDLAALDGGKSGQHTWNALKALGSALDIDMFKDKKEVTTKNLNVSARLGVRNSVEQPAIDMDDFEYEVIEEVVEDE